MSEDATGYDQLSSQFSPEGRLYQVEYAQRAVSKSGTVIGLRGKDCVVLAAEKIAPSKLYESSATDRIFSASWHIGMALAGYVPDARHLLQVAMREYSAFKVAYNQDIPPKDLKLRVAMYVHSYTLYGAFRPFGAGLLMASSLHGPELFVIDPFGATQSYFGWAMGKNEEAAKNEIDQLDLKSLSAVQLVKEAARILYIARDENDQNVELELSWTGSKTRFEHQKVSKRLLRQAEVYAGDAVEARDLNE